LVELALAVELALVVELAWAVELALATSDHPRTHSTCPRL
jgi:hypothetical protein